MWWLKLKEYLHGKFSTGVGIAAAILLIIVALMIYWSLEPDVFDVKEVATRYAGGDERKLVTGYVTTSTLVETIDTLLDKPGGYLRNDVMPPGLFMDNMPGWEYGVLVQSRDLALSLRNDMSRSQTQSTEDRDLADASNRLNIKTQAWMFPSAEGQYRDGRDFLENYLKRLADPDEMDGQFYARADNLRDWLALVEKRLGDLSQRLSASVGQERVNVDLRGDTAATYSTARPSEMMVKTPWLEIDDVFYEARGSCWALLHFLRAAEIDFASVLAKKNAQVGLRQSIRELEGTQDTMWSPMILNGSGFGFVANHSLVMANYISRANAALIDLRRLLEQG